MKHIFLFIILCLTFSFSPIFSQQKAFPTAFGGGAFATGGRSGNVYHVTRLDDTFTNGQPTEGTLRWAIGSPRPATVVFDVSGTVVLDYSLVLEGNNLTIAGQTSPLGGITITTSEASNEFRIGGGSNIILRYLRIRPLANSGDAFLVYSVGIGHTIILDHISISYGGDEGFTVRGQESRNITFQRGLIAESKTGSIFGDSDNANSGLFSYDNSFLTSLFVNVSHRTPNAASSNRVDIINNVIYNWKQRMSVVLSGINLNHIGNYYFKGNLNTLVGSLDGNPRYFLNCGILNSGGDLSIYTAGNIIQDEFTNPNADNKDLWVWFDLGAQSTFMPDSQFTDTQYSLVGAPMPIMSAIEASNNVPMDCGANKFLNSDGSFTVYRDINDTDYVNMVLNDTPEEYSSSAGSGGFHTYVDGQRYANFLSSISITPITTRPENFYNPAKSEHIPEVFYDLYMPVGASHNDIAPSGYTWLEEYLNGVDGEVIDVPVVSLDIETPQNFTGLNLSESVDLDVTFNPTNATNQNGTWTTSNDGILEVNNSGIVTAVGIGTATIRFTSAFDATLFDEITIDVFFSASAGDDERVCENDDYLVELTATEGDSYLWSTEETTQSIFVSPLSTTNYSVEVTLGQAQSTADVTVFVDPNPNVIIENGTSVDILNGDFVTITASGANTYEWNNGASQPNIAVSPSQTTTYDVRGYINDCYDDKSIVVNVFEPVVAYAGENVLICLDESVVLTASGGTEFLWSTGETTPSIEVAPTETTDYFVTVFNPIDFDEASVTVEVDASCATEPIDGIDGNTTLGMHMYPNPANSSVNIKLTGTFETSEVEFYDITGKRVLTKEITNEFYNPTVSAQVDISRFTSGIYFVKLKDDGGEVTKKLIVK